MTKTIAVVSLVLLAATVGVSHATTVAYRCGSGARLVASFSPPSAKRGHVVLRMSEPRSKMILPQVVSADGGRYANNSAEFWIKGNSATLTRNGRRETCRAMN